MALTIPCTLQPKFSTKPPFQSTSSSSGPAFVISPKLNSQFLGSGRSLGWCGRSTRKLGPSSCGSRTTCWFRFGNNGVDSEGAGIYGSQCRNDFDRDDVEQGDKPKIEELLRAGADYTVKDADGRTTLDRAASDEIKDFILGFSVQKA